MKLNTMPLAAVFLALLLVALFPPWSSGQTTGQKNPPLVISSMYGRDLFEFYCATCHGRDGRGGGPAVLALKVPPPDLTTIAMRNGGTFPDSTRRVLRDRRPRSPGARTRLEGHADVGPDLPSAGPGDTTNKLRIANIVGYIESMQQRK